MNFRSVLGMAFVACALVGCGVQDDLPGLRLSVTKVVVGGDDDGPWFQVWMRMKNTSDHQVAIPDAAIVCAGDDDEGQPAAKQDRHYAIKPGARIFVGSSAAGVMWLLPPTRPCAPPAVVKVTRGAESLDVKIPDSVVTGLNEY